VKGELNRNFIISMHNNAIVYVCFCMRNFSRYVIQEKLFI